MVLTSLFCVCASVRLCVCASVRLCVCAYVRLCVCASVSVSVCVCLFVLCFVTQMQIADASRAAAGANASSPSPARLPKQVRRTLEVLREGRSGSPRSLLSVSPSVPASVSGINGATPSAAPPHSAASASVASPPQLHVDVPASRGLSTSPLTAHTSRLSPMLMAASPRSNASNTSPRSRVTRSKRMSVAAAIGKRLYGPRPSNVRSVDGPSLSGLDVTTATSGEAFQQQLRGAAVAKSGQPRWK